MSALICDECGATPSADDYLVGSDCPACDDGILLYPYDESDDDLLGLDDDYDDDLDSDFDEIYDEEDE